MYAYQNAAKSVYLGFVHFIVCISHPVADLGRGQGGHGPPGALLKLVKKMAAMRGRKFRKSCAPPPWQISRSATVISLCKIHGIFQYVHRKYGACSVNSIVLIRLRYCKTMNQEMIRAFSTFRLKTAWFFVSINYRSS